MNYLAHAYLSFNHAEILAGNMISDFVKGRKQYDYSDGIQKGIRMHRAIDTFTDSHEATKEAIQFLKPAVGLYAGAFVDVAYDHFLANDPNEFTDDSLMNFATGTYHLLNGQIALLPLKFQTILPYMITHNWLYNYSHRWGIERSFEGVVRRAVYLHNSVEVFELFEKNYEALQKCYNVFFPSLKSFSIYHFKELSE